VIHEPHEVAASDPLKPVSNWERWTTVVSVVLACFVGQSFARFSFGLLLPAMKADLRISYGLVGWLGTINLAGYLTGTIGTSIASLHVPANRLLQFGTVSATTGIIVLARSTSTPALLVGMVLGGLGGAASWVPAPSVTASVFPPHRRGFAMGITSGGIGTGIVVSVLLTNFVRSLANDQSVWRTIWWAEGAIGLIAIMCAFSFLKPLAATGSSPKLSALRTVPRWWSPTFSYVCFGFAYVLFATFVVAGLQAESGFTSIQATFVFAAFGLGNLVGALGVGRLSDRVGRRNTMVASYALCGLMSTLVIHGPKPLAFAFASLFGVGMSGSVVSLAAHIGDHVPPQSFGAAFGAVTAAFGVSQMVGPGIGGALIDNGWGFGRLFALGGIVWLIGSGAALFMPPGVRANIAP
jgi:predicted MFS family arabinose efflux permease